MLTEVEEFAPAKVNLALHVLGRRADGYHDLDSIVAFADVGDTLTLRTATTTSLTVSGPQAANVPVGQDNLVLKAHALFSEIVPVPQAAMHLVKRLPVASGIGGGSADAAAALRGLQRLAGAALPSHQLDAIALKLGADVPVCLLGKTCRMQGVGERLTRLDAPPSPAILLVNPGVPCNTADVFRAMGLKAGDVAGAPLDPAAPQLWRNDMTDAAVSIQPAIADVLRTLQDFCPGQTVRMSGSGATCFALFGDENAAANITMKLAKARPEWWVAPASLI